MHQSERERKREKENEDIKNLWHAIIARTRKQLRCVKINRKMSKEFEWEAVATGFLCLVLSTHHTMKLAWHWCIACCAYLIRACFSSSFILFVSKMIKIVWCVSTANLTDVHFLKSFFIVFHNARLVVHSLSQSALYAINIHSQNTVWARFRILNLKFEFDIRIDTQFTRNESTARGCFLHNFCAFLHFVQTN